MSGNGFEGTDSRRGPWDDLEAMGDTSQGYGEYPEEDDDDLAITSTFDPDTDDPYGQGYGELRPYDDLAEHPYDSMGTDEDDGITALDDAVPQEAYAPVVEGEVMPTDNGSSQSPRHSAAETGHASETTDRRPPRIEMPLSPNHPYDVNLVLEQRATIIGRGQSAEEAADRTILTVKKGMEIGAEQRGERVNAVIIVADYRPAPVTRLGKSAGTASSAEIRAIKAPIVAAEGGLNLLPLPTRLAVIADAASAGDDEKADLYENLMSSVASALGTDNTAEIIEGVKVLRGARPGKFEGVPNETTLPRSTRETILAALNKDKLEALRPIFEPLGAWLDKNFSREKMAANANIKIEAKEGGVPVIHLTVAGTGRDLRREREMLSQAMLAMSGNGDTPWGPVAYMALKGAEHANAAVFAEITEQCKQNELPMLVSVNTLNEDAQHILSDTALGFAHLDSSKAEELASSAIGTTERADITGTSRSEHANIGSSVHAGVSFGYTKGENDPNTGGTSGSRDKSSGLSWDNSESMTIGEGPKVRASVLAGLGSSEILVVDSHRNPIAIYDVHTRRKVRDVPPPRDESTLDVQAEIDNVKANYQAAGAAALNGASAAVVSNSGGAHRALEPDRQPTTAQSVTGDIRGSAAPETPEQFEMVSTITKPPLGLPTQERDKLATEFNAATGMSIYGLHTPKVDRAFVGFAYRRYLHDRETGVTKRSWESWAERHGIAKKVKRVGKEDDGTFELTPQEQQRLERRGR